MPAGNNCRVAVILFGTPGSGKGTQAKLLERRMGVPHISTGDMLRERIDSGDAFGKEVKEIMESGRLVPDEWVNRLVADRIGRADAAKGFLLDGYPRTVSQARTLTEMLRERGIEQVIVHLNVDYNEVIARLSARRQCPRCGALYNLVSSPPKADGVCDRDGSRLAARDDDREAVIRQRLDSYERQTVPVLEYYARDSRRSYAVDGNDGAPEAIAERILGLVSGG